MLLVCPDALAGSLLDELACDDAGFEDAAVGALVVTVTVASLVCSPWPHRVSSTRQARPAAANEAPGLG